MGSSKPEPSDDSSTESDDATRMDTDTEKAQTDEESPRTPASSPFEVNEKVLAFHNHWFYDAKVRKVEYRMKQWKFYVHYLGWKKKEAVGLSDVKFQFMFNRKLYKTNSSSNPRDCCCWDEWVEVDRLMKFNDENIKSQQVINKQQEIEKNLKLGRAHMKPRNSNAARGKKRKPELLNKDKGSIPMEHVVNVQIPPTLKKQLVDDCEFITHLGKLVKLPRNPNVDEILNKYCDYRSKKDGLRAGSTEEIVKGLRCYFDKALPAMLLYKSERQQYEDAVAAGDPPSTIYGAEHLLRLFVKLPELLVSIKIEEETLTELQQNFVDFLKFLQKNQSAFFLSTYHVAEDVETSTNKQDD